MENDALQIFYEKYSKEIYLYLYSICGSRKMAEDLMQEVFLKALLSLETSGEFLRPWLYKVARNTCLNHLRKVKREIVSEALTNISAGEKNLSGISGLIAGVGTEPEEILEKMIKDERKRILYQSMMELPVQQREILELFYFSEMSVKEIAVLLKLTSENVRVLAHRARKTLRKIMEVNGYDI